MYHFLPLAEKRALRRDYRTRFIAVSLGMLALLTLFGSALLLPTWFVSGIKEQTVLKRLEILNNAISKNKGGELDAILENTKSEIKILTKEKDFLQFRTVLETVIDNRLPGVSLRDFTLARSGKEGDITVIVSGVYRDRDSIVNFRKNLESERMFTNVNLPIADLAKGRNAEFSIGLTAIVPKP